MRFNFFDKTFNFSKAKAKESKESILRSESPYSAMPFFNLENFGRNQISICSDTFSILYARNSTIYTSVKLLSQTMGVGGLNFFDSNEENKVVDDNTFFSLNKILNSKFVKFKNFTKQKEQAVRDFCVEGNFYWHLLKNEAGSKVLGFEWIDPRTIAVLTDQFGDVIGYVQNVRGEQVIYSKSEIAHWKNGVQIFSPSFGMSPLEPVLWDAWTDLEASITNHSIFKNGAIPDAIGVLQEDLKEEEILAVKELIESKNRGAQNAHRLELLPHLKDIKMTRINNRDLEYLSGRKFIAKKIAQVYGVSMFNLGDNDGTQHKNGKELMTQFLRQTIVPLENDFIIFLKYEVFPKIDAIEGTNFAETVTPVFEKQSIETNSDLEIRALKELEKGVLTPSQYKRKTKQKIEDEDLANPMFDKHIIYAGSGAILLEDAGDQDLEKKDNE